MPRAWHFSAFHSFISDFLLDISFPSNVKIPVLCQVSAPMLQDLTNSSIVFPMSGKSLIILFNFLDMRRCKKRCSSIYFALVLFICRFMAALFFRITSFSEGAKGDCAFAIVSGSSLSLSVTIHPLRASACWVSGNSCTVFQQEMPHRKFPAITFLSSQSTIYQLMRQVESSLCQNH